VFDSRATATEFLDRADCDPTLVAAGYRFMETVNYRFGGKPPHIDCEKRSCDQGVI
jgi:hypothetical protein